MPLADDIKSEVTNTFRSTWAVRDGRRVPSDTEIGLANDGVRLDAAILYADLVDSSGLVEKFKPEFAAEVYKSYLVTACRVIRSNGGEITAFDGDRVMSVFLGDQKESVAARTAMQINFAIKQIVNVAIKARYTETSFEIQHVVGIDTGSMLVAKTGIRGSNDLVWVGRCANVSAKLCAIRPPYATWITDRVHASLSTETRLSRGQSMWEGCTWNGATIYRSNYWWQIL
jgi:class 3 adenylate cyclase